MRKASFVAVVSIVALVLVTGVSTGQEAPREEALARELLEVSGAGAMGVQVVRQMVNSLAASNPDVPQDFWDGFVEQVDPKELETLIVPIYTKHLTPEEMEAAIAFYRTPAGQSMLRKMPVIVQESMQAGQQWGMELARRVNEQLEAREESPPEP